MAMVHTKHSHKHGESKSQSKCYPNQGHGQWQGQGTHAQGHAQCQVDGGRSFPVVVGRQAFALVVDFAGELGEATVAAATGLDVEGAFDNFGVRTCGGAAAWPRFWDDFNGSKADLLQPISFFSFQDGGRSPTERGIDTFRSAPAHFAQGEDVASAGNGRAMAESQRKSRLATAVS